MGIIEKLNQKSNVRFTERIRHGITFRGKAVSTKSGKLTEKKIFELVDDEYKLFIIMGLIPVDDNMFKVIYADMPYDGIKKFNVSDYVEHFNGSININTSEIKESPYFDWYMASILYHIKEHFDVKYNEENLIYGIN